MRIDVDIAVIGGGPAGLAAAIAAREAGAERVMILERDRHLGGILQQCIHNGFGLHYFKEELTGPEYAQRFIEKLEGTGIRVEADSMVLEVTPDKLIRASSAPHGVLEIQARAVILAMGCRERTRGALNIPGSRPAGVYMAGSAQLLVNMHGVMPGKKIVILGSGDIGLIMARRMVWEGARVEMVCEIMPFSSGLTRNIVQCLEDNDIPIFYEHTVTRIHGMSRVEGVTVSRVDKDRNPIPGSERFVECDTLLLSVGLIPENEITQLLGVEMDPVTSGAVVDQDRQTSVPGIFACGNVLHVHDLVDFVSEEAQLAGKHAARYIIDGDSAQKNGSVKSGEGVRYTVPQRLSGEIREALALYFRVGRVYRNAQVVVTKGGREIMNKKSRILTPGEMQRIDIKPERIRGIEGDITVAVREEQG